MTPLHIQAEAGRKLLLWTIRAGVAIPGILFLIVLVASIAETISGGYNSFSRIWLFIGLVLLFFVGLGFFAGRGMLQKKKIAQIIWTGLGTAAGLFFTISGLVVGGNLNMKIILIGGIGLPTLVVSLLPALHPNIRAFYKLKPGEEMAELLDEIGRKKAS